MKKLLILFFFVGLSLQGFAGHGRREYYTVNDFSNSAYGDGPMLKVSYYRHNDGSKSDFIYSSRDFIASDYSKLNSWKSSLSDAQWKTLFTYYTFDTDNDGVSDVLELKFDSDINDSSSTPDVTALKNSSGEVVGYMDNNNNNSAVVLSGVEIIPLYNSANDVNRSIQGYSDSEGNFYRPDGIVINENLCYDNTGQFMGTYSSVGGFKPVTDSSELLYNSSGSLVGVNYNDDSDSSAVVFNGGSGLLYDQHGTYMGSFSSGGGSSGGGSGNVGKFTRSPSYDSSSSSSSGSSDKPLDYQNPISSDTLEKSIDDQESLNSSSSSELLESVNQLGSYMSIMNENQINASNHIYRSLEQIRQQTYDNAVVSEYNRAMEFTARTEQIDDIHKTLKDIHTDNLSHTRGIITSLSEIKEAVENSGQGGTSFTGELSLVSDAAVVPGVSAFEANTEIGSNEDFTNGLNNGIVSDITGSLSSVDDLGSVMIKYPLSAINSSLTDIEYDLADKSNAFNVVNSNIRLIFQVVLYIFTVIALFKLLDRTIWGVRADA